MVEAGCRTVCLSYCWTLKVLNWKMAIPIQVESMLCTRILSLYRWRNAWLPFLVSNISNLQHKLQFCMYGLVLPSLQIKRRKSNGCTEHNKHGVAFKPWAMSAKKKTQAVVLTVWHTINSINDLLMNSTKSSFTKSLL